MKLSNEQADRWLAENGGFCREERVEDHLTIVAQIGGASRRADATDHGILITTDLGSRYLIKLVPIKLEDSTITYEVFEFETTKLGSFFVQYENGIPRVILTESGLLSRQKRPANWDGRTMLADLAEMALAQGLSKD
jgi:hypothetical protein